MSNQNDSSAIDQTEPKTAGEKEIVAQFVTLPLDLFSADDAARFLDVDRAEVDALIENGELRAWLPARPLKSGIDVFVDDFSLDRLAEARRLARAAT